VLYKYFHIERRGLLHDGLIRFTQPREFNDPFELHPSFDLMSRADIAALPEVPGEPGSHQMTPEVMAAMLNSVLPGLREQMARHAGQEGAYMLDNNRMAQSSLNSQYGILCLTEVPDSLLMWAHYANSHNGFVLQFDETDPFFAPSQHEGLSLELKPVEYSPQRPVLSYSTLHSHDVFYRKSPEWAYEREWRIIKPLSGADSVITRDPFSIHLFRLPLSAIKGVIVGQAVANDVRQELLAVPLMPDTKHITVHQTSLSRNDYKIEIHPPIDGRAPENSLHFVPCAAR
jgi:hypothetical protein